MNLLSSEHLTLEYSASRMEILNTLEKLFFGTLASEGFATHYSDLVNRASLEQTRLASFPTTSTSGSQVEIMISIKRSDAKRSDEDQAHGRI